MAILHKSKTIIVILIRYLRNLTYIKANTGYAESESQNTEINDESHNYHIGHIIVALFAAKLHDTLQPLINRIHFTDVRPKAWSFYSLN